MQNLLFKLNQMDDLTFSHTYQLQSDTVHTHIITYLKEERAQLREQLGAQNFLRLLQLEALSNEAKTYFLETLSGDEFLFYRPEYEENAVVIRSTAAFLLTQLITTMPELDHFQFAYDYLAFEKDGRAMVNEDIGWSDAISASIDLLTATIKHPNLPDNGFVSVLQAIRTSLWSIETYSNCEEERFAKLIIQMLKNGLPEAIIIEWMEQLFDKLSLYAYEYGHDLRSFKARANTMNVMRALYFASKFSNQSKELTATISLFIQKNMN